MIEFTFSRIAVFVCGAILLVSIATPISDIYESREEKDMRGIADNVSGIVDSFWDSEADILKIRGWDVLPSPEFSIQMEGHNIIVSDSDKTYTSLISCPCDGTSISYNQEATFGKLENTMFRIQ